MHNYHCIIWGGRERSQCAIGQKRTCRGCRVIFVPSLEAHRFSFAGAETGTGFPDRFPNEHIPTTPPHPKMEYNETPLLIDLYFEHFKACALFGSQILLATIPNRAIGLSSEFHTLISRCWGRKHPCMPPCCTGRGDALVHVNM